MKMFMNQSSQLKQPDRTPSFPKKPNHAFTLTELLVVLATLAVLALVLLPALAGTMNKGGRAQCANNLRQIDVASMIYATEYRDLMPICKIGSANSGANLNNLAGMHYTRYVAYGTANSFVPTNANLQVFGFDCLGFLYHVSLAGNGSIFYCPDDWGSPLGANSYLPLLTTDSVGIVRSSYAFNPRIVDATNYNIARRYQKTSDLPPHKLFVVDYFGYGFAHFRERGWNVLFTDGSVQFSRNNQAYNLILTTPIDESITSLVGQDQIFNLLELDH